MISFFIPKLAFPGKQINICLFLFVPFRKESSNMAKNIKL